MTDALLTTAQYREATGLAERTLKRYLADGKIPGASKDAEGRWRIPATAMPPVTGPAPVRTELSAELVAHRAARRELEAQPTLADVLARASAYVDLEQAARLLGVTEYAIRHNPDRFGVERFGPNGSMVVPLRIIREVAGL